MPRVYKPKPGAKIRKQYDELVIKQALEELNNTENISLSSVAKKYGISKSVLGRHKLYNMKRLGGQTALSMEAEEYIVQNLNICADWGYPLTTMDLRHIVKMYLDSTGIEIKKFKNNFPGSDYVTGFLKRHKNRISIRICQNINRARATVSPQTIRDYFMELETSIQDIPASNIINYYETNLADDPGKKQVIVKRGCKYPERVMNHSKGSVSIMIAAAADGEMLPPYVVYKASYLHNTWVANGPPDTRYNRSEFGWFDGEIFADWVKMSVIPILDKKPGKKVLIGDNLSSHLSADLIKLCKEKDIHFIFVPANSTHITQPLDVAFFRPMKIVWRNILETWKRTDGRTFATIPKACFPRLLNLLLDQLKINSESNIKAGFRKTGIFPLDVNQIVSRLPQQTEQDKEAINGSFVKLLKEMRFGTKDIKEPKNKRKLEVVSGRSVSAEKTEQKKMKTESKGKGKGKKSKQIMELNTENKNENGCQNLEEAKGEMQTESLKAKGGEIRKKSQAKVEDKENRYENSEEAKGAEIGKESQEHLISQMPIFFTDDLELCQEIIVSSDQLRSPSDANTTSSVLQGSQMNDEMPIILLEIINATVIRGASQIKVQSDATETKSSKLSKVNIISNIQI